MEEANLICPITRLIFCDPVLAEDGHIYEREAIEEWCKKKQSSPVSREKITSKFIPVVFVKTLVNEYLKQNPTKQTQQYVPFPDFTKNKIRIFEFIKNNNFNELLNYNNYKISQLLNSTFSIQKYESDDTKKPVNYYYYLMKNCKDIRIINHIMQNKVLVKGLECLYNLMPEDYLIDYINRCPTDKIDRLKQNSSNGWNISHFLVKRKFMNALKILLDKIPDYNLNHKTAKAFTPLSFAIRNRDNDMIKFLIDKGVDISISVRTRSIKEFTNSNNQLILAVSESLSFEIIKYMIEKGKFIASDKNGRLKNLLVATIISYNHSKDQLQLINYLLNECNVTVNLRHKEKNIIHLACRYSSNKIIRLLIDLGSKLDVVCTDGYMPHMNALRYRKYDAFRYMLSKGVDVTIPTNEESLLVHWLAQNGSLKLFKEMHDKFKFDLNIKNSNGTTPLIFALKDNRDIRLCQFLINEANVDEGDNDGWKPIHYAFKHKLKNIKLLKQLIHKISDINCLNNSGYRPIHYACIDGNEEIVRELINKGSDLEAELDDGNRPIHLIASNTKFSDDFVKYLIDEKNVNIRWENKDGYKPIHYIALNRQIEFVKTILSKDIDTETNIKDKQGKVIYSDLFELLLLNASFKTYVKSHFSFE
ncbi:ankyrin repeat protein [Fadolivirus algeromassiliense]|jgi:ankyrin repeat protein|uniref:Ankyrin repeat protein n=1 Tax=Fadolivirus FV1/VV64 TaxID=3070911 RepID=A0A7D3V5M9_9VIRU|nr:ankyrin repeat protein [Fadolivirus algeromassiliense]QKF94275.1 ankyrin repeat protein [Fadolivirus FV1/VV64]